MNSRKLILSASLALNVAAAVAAGAWLRQHGGFRSLFAKPLPAPTIGYAQNKASVFAALPPCGPGDVVLLGNSLLDLGEWGELMPHVKNRGISGNTTADVLARLESIGNPSQVVLEVGINDLQGGLPVTEITARHRQIVTKLRAMGVTVWILPVLPVNEQLYRREIVPLFPRINMPRQADVEALNRALAEIAGEGFVSLPVLEDGQLAGRYTLDGLHLNGEGLKVAAVELNRRLRP